MNTYFSIFRSTIVVTALMIALTSPVRGVDAPTLLPFQGRLTDQNGNAVGDGVRLVQFKIYDVPTGGTPVWAGELHRTTINGGLVNVMLGSKTPLTGVDFDKQLYLEITVDVSGPSGEPDNAITLADPPMLPRQTILPVVFAKGAADSRELAGYDWTPIFGTNDPTQPIPGYKLAPSSLTLSMLTKEVLDELAPAGTILAYGGETNTINEEDGWLVCDGRPLSSAQYPRLFANIRTNWGAGILGSTNNFNLPDLRGMFLRGVSGSRADGWEDPDATGRLFAINKQVASEGRYVGGNDGNRVGSAQPDAFKSHTHPYDRAYGGGLADNASGGNPYGGNKSANTGAKGGKETRPRNAYVNYIIKY